MLKFIKKVQRKIENICTGIRLILSFAIAIASVSCALFVPTKFLGVPIAAVGCFASGWMFSVCFSKMKKYSCEFQNTESLKEENADLAKENAAKAQEIERLKNQRIELNSFSPIFKLGLLETDMSVKDVKVKWLDDFTSGIRFLADPKRSQYVGVLERSFKMTYGVDMNDVRIFDKGDHLCVVGIKPANMGMLSDRSRWLVRQVNKYHVMRCDNEVCDQLSGFQNGDVYYVINPNKAYEGRQDPNSTEMYVRSQEEELNERINNGVGKEFSFINEYLCKMAETVVRAILSPAKKTVVFSNEPVLELSDTRASLSIKDYVKYHNEQIDNKISEYAFPKE